MKARICRRILAYSAAAVLFWPGFARATDRYVDPTSPDPTVYDTINLAYAAAASGDVIHIAKGTYNETVPATGSLTKRVTFVGAGTGCTDWRATGTQVATISTTGNVTFSRLTLTPGSATALVLSAGTLTLRNVEISGGSSAGGGSHLRVNAGTTASLYDSELHGGTATGTGKGGSILVNGNGVVYLARTNVYDNTATLEGGAVFLAGNGARLFARFATFDNNVGREGGAVYATQYAVLVDVADSTFTNNQSTNPSSAHGGGAIYAEEAARLLVSRSHFEANVAADRGGAIEVDDPTVDVTITDSVFLSNRADGTVGGAIRCECSFQTMTLQGNRFEDNVAMDDGGAVSLTDGMLVLDDSVFVENQSATGDGGAVALSVSNDPASTVNVTSCDFSQNTATADDAGALFVRSAASATISDSRFWKNTSGDRAGAVYTPSTTTVTIESNDFCANTAVTTGGGASAYGAANLLYRNNVFRFNTANKGGGIYVDSAGLPQNVDATNNTFVSNSAAISEGGGIGLYGSGSWVGTDVRNNVFHLPVSGRDVLKASLQPATDAVFAYNLFSGTVLVNPGWTSDNISWEPPSGTNITGDGSVVTLGSSADCSVGNYYPSVTSDADDAGDPATTYDDARPSAGTGAVRNDMGAYGGPFATLLHDVDGDGHTYTGSPYGTADDCDDADPTVKPGAYDAHYDGIDANCDGVTDYDRDGDGYTRIGAPDGTKNDCDDDNSERYPGATEIPWDGIVQNCNTLPATESETDVDRDGYHSDFFCGDDCDDNDAAFHPFATEGVGDELDQDCNGAEICYYDGDDDDWLAAARTTVVSADVSCTNAATEATDLRSNDLDDCNDALATVYPGAPEAPGDETDQSCDGTEVCYLDGDEDGFAISTGATVTSPDVLCRQEDGEAKSSVPRTDCNDALAAIRPGATELWGDEVDQNCDGAETCYYDGDDDDWLAAARLPQASPDVSCTNAATEATSLHAADADDCNDAVASTHPLATEVPGDNIDQDCSGGEICYKDADKDGYADVSGATVASTDTTCATADGEATATAPRTDCNDAVATIHPTATETIGDQVDQNCDTDEICYADADKDGYADDSSATVVSDDLSCLQANGEATNLIARTDCDDTDGSIHPLATEGIADEVDQNCDGAETCYRDVDQDGYADESGATVASPDTLCLSVDGEADAGVPRSDCNDSVFAIRPGVTEIVGDEADQNCDDDELCYRDGDGDTWLPAGRATVVSVGDVTCGDDSGEATDLHFADADDCNDAVASIHPLATEILGNQVDEDCNGGEICYADGDEDGYAEENGATVPSPDVTCARVDGEASSAVPRTDCDDATASVYPTAPEVYANGVDEDCNDQETCYYDGDDDDWLPAGRPAQLSPDLSCTNAAHEATGLHAAGPDDCDDANAAVHPTASEIAGDERDQDCDGDEDCYRDGDGDTWLPAGRALVVSLGNLICGNDPLEADDTHAADADDCNDGLASVYPGAPETPGNQVDENCDGGEVCYADGDKDGYAHSSGTTVVSTDASCLQTDGEASSSVPRTDCNDAVAAIRPGVAETVGDEVDQNCDGDEVCFKDSDDDGYVVEPVATVASPGSLSCSQSGEARASEPSGDCNDSVAAIRPNAVEIPGDEVDQNCDTQESCYADADDDGYVVSPIATVVSLNVSCGQAGEATDDDPLGDCNDLDSAIRPGVTELPGDEVDQNCNGNETCYADADGDDYAAATGATVSSVGDLSCDDAGEATDAQPRTDCNDSVFAIHPDVAETVGDEVDQNCDGDETCYADDDVDGWADESGATVESLANLLCRQQDGEAKASAPRTDCDDLVFTTHPEAPEQCNDIDDDCNDQIDDDVVTWSWYPDDDDDHYGRTAEPLVDCAQPEGYAALPDDCRDDRFDVNPGVAEIPGDEFDQDCDESEDCFTDEDQDGFARDDEDTVVSDDLLCASADGEATDDAPRTDCDDSTASIRPGVAELPGDEVDQDCDRDELCYADLDGDGSADDTDATVTSDEDLSCQDDGEADEDVPRTDCDDGDPEVKPGALEIPGNEVDDDCDGIEVCFADEDGDGYADLFGGTIDSADDALCDGDGEANADVPATDCNDGVAEVRPGVSEVAGDEIDQNCDGDELCYADGDDDGYADRTDRTVDSLADLGCDDSGEATDEVERTDCNDADDAISPDADEIVASGVDEDCDDLELCAEDADADGFADQYGSTVESANLVCGDDASETAPDEPATDCDDLVFEVRPGVSELPGDELDQNCDGDETCYADADFDGFASDDGAVVNSERDLGCTVDAGEATDDVPSTDCNDDDGAIRPDVDEVPGDEVDQNCDTLETCFADLDEDGFADELGSTVDGADLRCRKSDGEARDDVPRTDCNDANSDVNPDADEIAGDEADQDCDETELCYADSDGDGSIALLLPVVSSSDLDCSGEGEAREDELPLAGDCDDLVAAIHPQAEEVYYDGVDQDCDGASDFDADLDGYDSAAELVGGDDCDDADAAVHPGADEIPYDEVDTNCDAWSDFDGDLDGFDSTAYGGADCDDADADINPDASETWYDDVDGDCDGESDFDADGDGFDALQFGGDDCADGDRFQNPDATEVYYDGVDQDCDGASDYDLDGDGYDSVLYGGLDCRDNDVEAHPGAKEVWYDGVDQNCDGLNDFDQDKDGYVAEGYPGGTDCDDLQPLTNPDAVEVYYDGVDGNCDGESDYDADGDGQLAKLYGGTDCDDFDPSVYAGAPDIWYDGVDGNCAGNNDYDADGDGYGKEGTPNGTDCDDENANINPGVAENWYDGIDQDCDDGSDYDADGDGHDSVDHGGDDCDDLKANIHPGAAEVWYNGVDEDCDGGSDYDRDGDGFDSDAYGGDDCDDDKKAVNPGAIEIWYDGVDGDCDGGNDYDADGDGYPSSAWGGTDCDDANAAIRPGAVEVWYDGVDGNCDGRDDYDQDGDGYTATGAPASNLPSGDCADLDPWVNPGAEETWYDGVDQDCDGNDLDQDDDGYDSIEYGGEDCDDGDPDVNPGEVDVWDNEIDEDCDGEVRMKTGAIVGGYGCECTSDHTGAPWGLWVLMPWWLRRRGIVAARIGRGNLATR